MDIHGISSKGKVREENQDAIYIGERSRVKALLVADGMGGQLAGDVASRHTVEFFTALFERASEDVFDEQFIRNAILEVNGEILSLSTAHEEYKDMGTTLSLALIDASCQLLVAHIGDSRIYLYREGELRQLTKDQSYVQYLIDKGMLKKEEASTHPYRNVITGVIGIKEPSPQIFEAELRTNDMLLLCTDGLSGYVEDFEIEAVLDFSMSAKQNCDKLIELAGSAGGYDNVSVIVCKVMEAL